MASPGTIYQSVPLDRQKRDIRLLILHPSSEQNDDLICDLLHASFDDEVPKYEALSYEWGTTSPCYNLTINGSSLSIRKNLHSALIHLRKQSEERVLWIDAICMNQTDNSERSHQVQIMYLIYSKADRVIAWLGEAQPSDHGAKSAFENLSRYIASTDGNWDPNEIVQHYIDPAETSMPKYGSSDWTAIDSILAKTWFSRVWIIQELVMAPHLSFHCGDIELDRSVVENTVFFLSRSPLRTFAVQNSRMAFIMISTATRATSDLALSEPWTLMKVLWLARTFEASIPRDKLFAFLRIIKARHESFLVPDYDSEDVELYIQWAVHSLAEAQPFMCLSLACPAQLSPKENLPTWVPDWGILTSQPCLSMNASYDMLTSSPYNIYLSDCQKNLTLSGVRLDIIQAVGSKQAWIDEWLPIGTSTPRPAGHPEVSLSYKQFIDEAEELVTRAFSPREYPFDMFWRTLIVNSTPAGQGTVSQAPPEYAQSFKAYRELVDHVLTRGADETTEKLFPKAIDFDQAYVAHAYGRKFGITKGLRMGMIPSATQQGDVIFAPLGANIPFVLREAENGHYTLVGECYLHGVMYGEISEEPGWEKNIEDITIC